MNKIRWGVLGAARIARQKVIPAMQQGHACEIVGLASRSLERSRETADSLDIPKAFGSYEELLNDPDIDAVYIPLPNHLHVPWTLKTLEAGKHVLCEKPIALTFAEAQGLVEAARAYPHLKVMEAFMYRHHPQWQRTKTLVETGVIGELRSIQSAFSYFNADPNNIRNQADIGGGGLMDIGCYCVSLARFLFDREPERVQAEMKIDSHLGVDVLTSGILDFGSGTSTFMCSTQAARHQHVAILGTEGTITIEIPFNAPPDQPTRIRVTSGGEEETTTFEPANQYMIQGDLFSRAILDDTEVPVPISDAAANMHVIEALVQSDQQDSWVAL